MHLICIFCIDKGNGLMFAGRRQSQDSALREKILEISSNSKLWMSEYSARQFPAGGNFCADNEYILKAGAGEYCFCEDIIPDLKAAEGVILFKWNRDYPSDMFLEFNPKELGFKRKEKLDFEGSSHKKITMEVYGR